MASRQHSYDYDWLVIGSGFGGLVSALRLSEKGYPSGCWSAGDASPTTSSRSPPPTSSATLKPAPGDEGHLPLTTFKDVSVVSGCGVGGGSLGYACTLYVPPKQFFETGSGERCRTGRALSPLITPKPSACSASPEKPARGSRRPAAARAGPGDGRGRHLQTDPRWHLLRRIRQDVPDPFFGGEGPDRTGCHLCGVPWSAASMAPRTRWSRTTSTSRRSSAPR